MRDQAGGPVEKIQEEADPQGEHQGRCIPASSENNPLQAGLFTDAYLGITAIAANRPCGAGCMCNYFRLLRPGVDGKWHDYVTNRPISEIVKRLT